ncbi:GPI inositol-deacylase [Chelonus insularis]|uniref:GPI inositol-deacylase n=1 Tax=Chelonus insularis TaxID=460826 RepID=UPI00158C086F|nr:GPI inositol-deacylase [Chelonus insularis]
MAKGFVVITLFLSLISLFSLILYILGGVRYLTTLESHTCDMTFMFEYPQYVKIKLNPEIEKNYPKFGLYVYGEGYMVEKLRRMKFSGIPVLFIPGNAGSHEQVRSIASVSLRMSLKRKTSFHFDYFTVSLAKGLSALYGGVLDEQTQFVKYCIHHILNFYGGNVDKVLLIGHSMGGIVAKAALLQDVSSNTSLANILINLASPHIPSVAFDRTFANYYHRVNAQAEKLKQMGTTVISIGGGPRDSLVTSSQTIDPHADLNVLSSAIPNVWRSQDHLSILWCKQLIIVLVRSLFDCVDTSGRIPTIKSDSSAKLQALTYHLSSRYSGKKLPHYENKSQFQSNAIVIPVTSPQYTFYGSNYSEIYQGKRNDRPIYLMIPIKEEFITYDNLSVDTIDLETTDWLFACSELSSDSLCKWGWNFTNRTKLFPDHLYRLRKSVDLDLNTSRNVFGATHIIIKISAEDMSKKIPVLIHIDMYSFKERKVHIDDDSPSWLPVPINFVIGSSKSSTVTTEPGILRYYFITTGIPDAINIVLQSIDGGEYINTFGSVGIETRELWNPSNSVISQYSTLTEVDVGRTNTIRLQTPVNDNSSLYTVAIRVTLDPRFSYKIFLRRAGIIDRIVIFVRDRWFRLYPILIGLLLLMITMRMDNNKYKTLLTFGVTSVVSLISGLLFESCVAIGLLIVLAIATCCAVIFSGSIVHNLTARFLARALAHFPIAWYDWLLRQTLDSLPIFISFIFIVLISGSCAAIIMLLSVVFYFLKLTRMYEDYLEELFMASLRNFARKFRRSSSKQSKNDSQKITKSEDVDPTTNIINHLLLFITWYLTAASAIPTALVWAKNFSYETRLSTEDTTMFISWITLTGWASFGYVKITPFIENDDIKIQLILVVERILGWILLLMAATKNPATYQWTIPPVVAIFISCIVFLSIFVKTSDTSDDQNR